MDAVLAGISNFVSSEAVLHPVIATIILILTMVRAINKPLFSFIHSVDQAAGLTKVDAVVTEVETSKAYSYFCYFLDYVFSIKMGTQTPTAQAAKVVAASTPATPAA